MELSALGPKALSFTSQTSSQQSAEERGPSPPASLPAPLANSIDPSVLLHLSLLPWLMMHRQHSEHKLFLLQELWRRRCLRMSGSCPSADGVTSGPATCCPQTGLGTGACAGTGPAAQRAWTSTGLHPRCLRHVPQHQACCRRHHIISCFCLSPGLLGLGAMACTGPVPRCCSSTDHSRNHPWKCSWSCPFWRNFQRCDECCPLGRRLQHHTDSYRSTAGICH